MFVSFLGEAVHFKASEMMLQLLRGTRSCDYRSFVSDIFKVDLIEVLWWEVSTSNSKVETMKSSELRDLWYSLLNELCCNRDSALAIMEKDFLERFIVLESSLSNSGLLQDPANTSFLRLVSSVFHATNLSDHERYFKKAVPTMEILAELCLCTIVCIFDMNEAKWNATEVLYALAMHQDTLIGVWKACYLYPTQISDAALVKGTERLCAVSEMLLQCGNNVADLILVLTAVLKICRQSIDILIRARNLSECWPMINVLVQVLQQCISDPSASSRSYLRPIVLTTSNPADFLPYYFPTELHVKATVLALQLVQLCLADRQFTESLETESDLLRNLFVCIATSNWRVASAAAIELSTLIHCDPDVTNPEDDEDGVTRYMCDQGDYRYLEFFSDFATQEVVRVAPSSRFPPCFVLLVRWLRFYSVNVTLLSDVQMVEDFAQELESTKELAETTQLDVHEKFAGSILEILLYLVANYHSVIYTSDNSESEEKEHSLFLQSLLALCQRRPRSCLDNADTCIVSSCRVRSRALKLVQLLCSIDLPHTRSVQVFSNPQQMQILMMIVENSTSDVEQNSAAQLMEALALKDPVKNVLIRDTSLLFRLGAWLEIDKLQLLAAAIIQRLATPSSSVLNRSVFGFSPSIQQQLAHFLIVGVEQKKPSQVLPKKSKPLLREVYRLRIEMQLEEDIKRSPRQKSSTSLLSVQLRLEIVDQSGLCLRQFEYQATVRSGDEFCYHEFLMEPAASIVRCTILTRNAAEYEDPKVRELELSRGIGSSTHRCDSVLLRFSEEPLRTSSVLSGILSRLLRQEIGPLSFEFFQALSGIVAEFCRDYSIFCDPVVDLPSQILVVLATSVEFAPAGKMDVTCLENLTTWFPNKPTVSNFKSIAPPVLHLIQNLRQLACIGDFTENLNYGSVLDSSASNFPQFWFLEKFVEFIGDVEVQDLTANVLNALFIENSDLLLYLTASPSKYLQPEDIKFDSELRELILFTNEHAELLSVLTVNRKKALTSAIRVATQNARVLMAFHSMTSLALDFYIDTAKKLQNQKKSKLNSKRRVSAIVNIGKTEQTVFLEWLLLLEQLAGLLCSGLHELDAVYYMEIVSQFRSLILDLPLFLRKMECMGTHSRREALMLFLDNLHRLVKRATNRNELRVVAANGSGIVDQTKAIRARLRKLDVHISTSLAALLEAREGMENLSRLLLAMQYMWRRMMGTTSVEKAMASSRESISLLKKIKEKFVSFTHALRRPRAVFGARHETSAATEFDSPSELLKASQGTESVSTDQSSQSSSEYDEFGVTGRNSTRFSSLFPFTSLDLLLDHFGWESVATKRTRQLLQSSRNKNDVIEVLKSTFGIGEEAVKQMTPLDLAEKFQELEETKKISDGLDQLQQLIIENDMPFENFPFVVHDKVEMSLWRLMVRPIQRVRLFHLYHQTQRFVLSDPTKRRIILESYRQVSPQRPVIRKRSRDELNSEAESPTKLVPKLEKKSTFSRYFGTFKKDKQRIGADQIVQEEPVQTAVATGPWNAAPSLKVVISRSTLKVCDGIFNPDPFSDDAAMILLRRKLEAKKKRKNLTGVTRFRDSSRSAQYRYGRQDSVLDRLLRGVILVGARLILLIAFWRQEELRTDLKDPIMAKAFDDPHARDEYYRLYHAKKGLGELVRVWMPTSGRLGLQLWQERHYALIGTLVSVTIVLWLPAFAFPDGETNTASKRNTFMTRIVYGYGIGIFLLAVVSIALIAQNRFVLLEQTRLRLRPVSRYYQNVLAVTAIGVELVQLNSLAFDSAVDWDSSDELPATVEWLGNQGITKFGFSSAAELEALGVLLLLLFWFLLLKCANKFRETSALLHRVLTKDLPALVHGFLYMSTISVFFSYLACMDCSVERNSTYEKCKQDPQSPPFLIAHKEITCWTAEHQWYALLGLWGITFFLPIGLLAHGMSQVLFQRETLDIKYAPVLILVVQLVKAAAATAQAFFPSDPILLASLGAVGNAVLLVLTLAMHSCSLWYIKYLKCGIYAASCWASLGAIHRLQYTGQSSTRSLNIIYFGWLSIGLTAASAILARVWLRARAKQRDTERHFAAQQRLLNADKASGILGVVEQKFMSAASKRCDDSLTRAAFISNARRLGSSSPPPVLKEFIAKASAAPGSLNEARGVLFVQSSRVLAKKLREHEELRRRW
ncbi:hypothetical protein PC110_g10541 [Phytophthora cactorum]|uniref:Uncharacterized protein n=2 Tax=Phytophthora cactorum TaxID=29920 RepID=A0A329SB55_9STRA|nr:hypothetical protein PC110_g10541 [Phytophthora cactorum]